MLIQKRKCDFCNTIIPLNSIDYEFPYIGAIQGPEAPTYSKVNLCQDCIERIKELRAEIYKENT